MDNQPPVTNQIAEPVVSAPLSSDVPPNKTPNYWRQRKLFVLVILLVIGLGTGALVYLQNHKKPRNSNQSSITTVPIQISITPNGFEPKTVQINAGQAIVWTNYDTKNHSVASDPFPTDNLVPGLKSDLLVQNQTFTFVFSSKGTFGYHDDANPLTVKGTILVK